MRVKKTAPFYFCNNFVKPIFILIIFAHVYVSKFPITSIFHIFYKIESREPASVSTAQRVCPTVKLLCREILDFIIAPNL